ncbi:MAG: glycosyltransferase [Acidobacteriota bacterium]|nr:glycosyltransferase [Acidobacteriota bacterium]
MKSILIITKAFFPEISPRSFRATELAKEFARQGHRVEVYLPQKRDGHLKIEKDYNITLKAYGPLTWKPLVIKGGRIRRLLSKIIQRSATWLFEYPDIEIVKRLPKIINIEKHYDIIISIAAPHSIHWAVSRALKKNKNLSRLWVADCGDPYMGAILETFKKPFYFKYMEKDFCLNADFITVPTEGAKEAYYPEFRHKIRVIPQGFNFEEVITCKEEPCNPVPTFAYAGSLAFKGMRNPERLLHYLSKKDSAFRFHIYSNSSLNVIHKYRETLGNKVIVHRGKERIPLLYELSKMDFLINFDNGTERQLPSKLIDYALTGRPILNIHPLNPNIELANQFLKKNYEAQYAVNNLERYNIKNVVFQFMTLKR